jgi:predicted flap endonuclease-1-like 5' DNA nuclease
MKYLALLVIVAIIVVVWWWWRNRRPGEPTSATVQKEPVSFAPIVEEEEPVSFAVGAQETPAPEPDDLKRIEGIGPKISSVLQENGILTFGQLAAADTERLSQILMDAGLRRLADPATWPEQAGLAAAGKWDELAKLQDELQGGRRE